jgi:hypothetical protein
MTRYSISIALMLLLLGSLGCEEQRNDVSNAVEAAKGMAELASSLKKAGEQAEVAAKEAEKQAAADLAAGKDPAQVQQQTEMAKGLAAMQALGGQGGPAVNWRKLAPFLPDAIGELKADGDVKGETQKMGAFENSKVSRRYKLGESNVSISIADGSAMPLLRTPFAMAAMVSEDSSEGFKKGTKIEGHTAIVEWREKSKRSEATALIGERFVLNVEASKAAAPEAAENILKQIKLADLAKLTPDEEKK